MSQTPSFVVTCSMESYWPRWRSRWNLAPSVTERGKPLSCSGVGTAESKCAARGTTPADWARCTKYVHSLPDSQTTRRAHSARLVAARCMKPNLATSPNLSTSTWWHNISVKFILYCGQTEKREMTLWLHYQYKWVRIVC